jgi:DNA-binding beta-propeller fold protein YncE
MEEGSKAGIAVLAATIAAALLSPAAGIAATDLAQKAGTAGCITETGSSGQCQDGRGLVGSTAIALSPDNHNAYVASSSWNSISILTLDPEVGTLAPIDNPTGCFHSLEVFYSACTVARQLGGADDIAVSPDGKSVYAASYSDNAIVVFDRDPLTGQLTLSAAEDGCVNGDGSHECVEVRGLEGPRAVIVSPDDENVYVASAGSGGGIASFDRNTATGDIMQKGGEAGCLNAGGAEGCASAPLLLLDTRGLTISPDGQTVYAGSRTHEVITVYDRDAEGVLTMKPGSAGCIDEAGDNGCQDGTALIDPDAITVSPDGEGVYVASSRSDAIAIFDRDKATGELVQKPGKAGCVSNSGSSDPMQAGTAGACQDGRAMDEISSVAVLPDGTALYAAAGKSSGIVIFERHTDGSLAQRPESEGCTTDTGYEDVALSWTAGYCEDGRALLKASDVVIDSDSNHVYTAARESGIGIFDVVPPPVPAPTIFPQFIPEGRTKEVSPACRRARAMVRRVEHRLTRLRQKIHVGARRARRTNSRPSRNKHARTARRARRSLNRVSAIGRQTRRRMRKACGIR